MSDAATDRSSTGLAPVRVQVSFDRAAGARRAPPSVDPARVLAAAARSAWRGVFQEALGPPPLRVLDVASGDGDVALLLDAMGHYVHGVEADEQRVRRARRRADEACGVTQFHVGEAEDLEFRAGTFDVVHARDALGRARQPEIALLEWFRVLHPGGLVLVAESAPRVPPADALRTAGFACVEGIDVAIRSGGNARKPSQPWFRPWSPPATRFALAWGRRP